MYPPSNGDGTGSQGNEDDDDDDEDDDDDDDDDDDNIEDEESLIIGESRIRDSLCLDNEIRKDRGCTVGQTGLNQVD